jgi:hypothetical protein
MSDVCFVGDRKYNPKCNEIRSKFENYDIYKLTNEQKTIIAEILQKYPLDYMEGHMK